MAAQANGDESNFALVLPDKNKILEFVAFSLSNEGADPVHTLKIVIDVDGLRNKEMHPDNVLRDVIYELNTTYYVCPRNQHGFHSDQAYVRGS